MMVRAKRSGTPTDVEVGRRIRAVRVQRKVTQSELAKKLRVSFQQVQKYEKGANRVAPERLETIAKALDVSVAMFFPSMDADTHVDANTFAVHDRDEQRLLERYGQLGHPLRRVVVDFVDALAGTTADMVAAAAARVPRRRVAGG